jgi:hypothetical protein
MPVVHPRAPKPDARVLLQQDGRWVRLSEHTPQGPAESREPDSGYDSRAHRPSSAGGTGSHPDGTESLRTYLSENEADLEAIVEGNYAVSPIVKALLVRHERGEI